MIRNKLTNLSIFNKQFGYKYKETFIEYIYYRDNIVRIVLFNDKISFNNCVGQFTNIKLKSKPNE